MAALAMPSPRPALKRSAEQAEVEARSPSPRSSAGDAAVRREAMVPLLMPRLTLNQINVMGSPEAERQVQEMQGQLVHMAVDMQKLRSQFRTEADEFCEGRAQDRQIYQEAFLMAERFYEQKAQQYADHCRGFLREEIEQLSRRHEQESATFQRLREHEIQRAREVEMRANAIKNQEVSVSQERYLAQQEVQHLHKEAFQLRRQQEASVAEAHQAVNELTMHQRRYDQVKDNMAEEMQRETDRIAEQLEAMWRQECQKQKINWEQECRQLKLESQHAQGHLLDRGRQDREEQLHLQERAITLQNETASMIQEQHVVVSERQAAHQAGLRAREMELQAQQQSAELDRQKACGQQEWQLMQQECAV